MAYPAYRPSWRHGMAYFRGDEVTKHFLPRGSNLFFFSAMDENVLFRHCPCSIFVENARASYKYRPIDRTEIMILSTSAKSLGMHSILRSSVRRITCSSKLMSGGGGGGVMVSSSPIKFRLPAAAAAVVASAQSIPSASFSQASHFSTAPDLNDSNQTW